MWYVRFYVDGDLIDTLTTPPYSTIYNFQGGAGNITVTAWDTANNQASDSRSVNVTPPADTTPPSVSIIAPSSGAQVWGTTTISANVTDNVAVWYVRFYVDGDLIDTLTTPPYSTIYNFQGGAGNITVTAWDTANNQASDSRSVNVTPPAPVLTREYIRLGGRVIAVENGSGQ